MSLNKKKKQTKTSAQLQKLNRRLTVFLTIFLVATCVLSGLLIKQNFGRMITPVSTMDKIESAIDTMSNDWYFAKDIDDIEERLLNQALDGITNNEEDKHTYYMTSEEMESFVQSINRNFVGIGVQFISYGDGLHMIQRVFKNSPAEAAGVQAGDIIHAVDGTIVDNMSNDNIADLVRGEEGTNVSIDFIRDGETITLDITRASISATVYGEVKDGIGYLEILQFGESTTEEAELYLNEFNEQGITKLIIDLRDDGGGYLTALQSVAGLFLGNSSIALKEVDASENVEVLSTKGTAIWNTNEPIVILVNGNTASAAEAFTLSLTEQRENVTVVGTTTYGKGTVQVTEQFSDGSAIKYTTSKWISANDVWINGTGIEPDVEVTLPEIISMSIVEFPEDTTSFTYDSVDETVKVAQYALEYLDYDVDRTDGYLSEKTSESIKAFQEEHDLDVTGELDSVTYKSLISSVTFEWNTTDTHDTQYHYAKDLLNG